ncbi:hypothetical protein I3842_Q125600 [Carya illinoinensis]|uniref:Uncharacterized protein n=1 Tax=Carya illinoinensis TaxID=32201 RepID=A0A921ZXL1_CARIL|nr:hypothetical protein I3842_Q125600 [Carya illinoinensis]
MESSQHDWGHRAARTSTTHRIQKVSFLLRDHKQYFVKYYEPRVVSLGPIHHGKEKYQLAETFKRKLAKEFVKSSGKTIEELCNEIEKNIKELRECFEEEVTKNYNDVDLAWILFVDGCTILQYIDLAINNKFKDLDIINDTVVFCEEDLFLLENQVPYDLLKLLMNLSNMGNELRNSVEETILRHNMVLMGKSLDQNGKRKPTHLLDLLRTSLLGPEKQRDKRQSEIRLGSDWQFYRNVQELKAAGIHVKRGKNNSLRGIYFSRKPFFYQGFLSLPLIVLDDSTGPKLLNLIAYEMCPDFGNDHGIASYVYFLGSLIDHANNVKELRKAHVLLNLHGNDEKAAQLFNELIATCTDMQVPAPGGYMLVEQKIGEYFDNKIMV